MRSMSEAMSDDSLITARIDGSLAAMPVVRSRGRGLCESTALRPRGRANDHLTDPAAWGRT